MKHPILLALGMIFALTACNHEGEPTTNTDKSTRLGPNPTLSGGRYSTGGGITIAAELRNIGGMTGICGAWAEGANQSSFSKNKAPKVLSVGSVYLGAKVLHRNLKFMRKVAPAKSYGRAQASCVKTAQAWQPSFAGRAPEIRMIRIIVYKKAGFAVTFIPGKPGAVMAEPAAPEVLPKRLILTEADRKGHHLGPNPTVGGTRFSTGGAVLIAAELKNIGGKLAVCGAWSEVGQQSVRSKLGQVARKVITTAQVDLGNRKLVKNLMFMRELHEDDFTDGAPIRCKVTNITWQPGHASQEINIRTPLRTFGI